jgi:hypothetical protein
VNVLLRYQIRLGELLDRGASPDEIRAALLADEALDGLRDYVQRMDDRALAVAVELRRTWGRKGPARPPQK